MNNKIRRSGITGLTCSVKPKNIKDKHWRMPQANIRWLTPFIQHFLWRTEMTRKRVCLIKEGLKNIILLNSLLLTHELYKVSIMPTTKLPVPGLQSSLVCLWIQPSDCGRKPNNTVWKERAVSARALKKTKKTHSLSWMWESPAISPNSGKEPKCR